MKLAGDIKSALISNNQETLIEYIKIAADKIGNIDLDLFLTDSTTRINTHHAV